MFDHLRNLSRHRDLIWQMMQREFHSQYRASSLGVFWAIATPVITLAIYTLVFGFIFQGSFSAGQSRWDFAMGMFCGLTVFGFFSACFTRSTTLMKSYGNFVTRVVFPLEVLPVVVCGVALLNMALAMLPLLAGIGIVHGGFATTALLFPVVILPFVILTLGIQWVMTSASVFMRDLAAVVPPLMIALMFGSAIFYPISSMPESVRWLVKLNPIAQVAQMSRQVLIEGQTPDWMVWFILLVLGLLTFQIGYVFFMKTKQAFADLL